MSRNKARVVAMQALFHLDSDPEMIKTVVDFQSPEEGLDENDMRYLKELLRNVEHDRERIDSDIQRMAIDWDISRLGKVERAILRLAIGEILFINDVPVSVAINEAVKLAKKFGAEQAAKFINGILGRFARETPENPEKEQHKP
jgi:transcription antitermination protein NusB